MQCIHRLLDSHPLLWPHTLLVLVNAHSSTSSIDTQEAASYLKGRPGGQLDLTPSSSLVYRHFHGRLNNIYSADILNLPLHSTANLKMVQDFRNSTIQGGSFLKVNGDFHFSLSGGSGESQFSTPPPL